MTVVIFGTNKPYEVPDEFVLERIENLIVALGGTTVPAASLVPIDTWDDVEPAVQSQK